jgi:hypothetical protein
MSAESLMASLGLSSNNRKEDVGDSKIISKYKPNNNYVIEPNASDLSEIKKLDNCENTSKYHIYQSELDIMRGDMRRLTKETETLLGRENKVLGHKEKFIELTQKRELNLPLMADEETILASMTLEQVDDWVTISIKNRSDSQGRKISMMDKIDELDRKSKNLLNDNSDNLLINRGGKLFLKFTAADSDLCQPNKRPKETVGLIFVRMLTKSEKLIKLSLTPCLDLLKEYRDCFNSSDRHYKKFEVAIRRIENNKSTISRFDLSQLMYDLLTPERQLDYIACITIVMKNPELKREMEKLAAEKERELVESKNKPKGDYKQNVSSSRTRGRGRGRSQGRISNRNNYAYKPFRQNNYNRGGRGRGNFRGRRGNNFGYNKYNNRQNNGYYNNNYNQNYNRDYNQNQGYNTPQIQQGNSTPQIRDNGVNTNNTSRGGATFRGGRHNNH